jgi:type IVB pilus formation R64 PilN family outer membrane protein
MKNPSLKIIGFTLVSALALSACSSDIGSTGTRSETSADIEAIGAQIDDDTGRLTRMTETGRPGNIRVRNGLYLGEDGFRTGRGDPLPRRFETDDAISIQIAEEMNLRDFSLHLRKVTGLRVDYRDITVTPMHTPDNEEGGEGASSGADSTGAGSLMGNFEVPDDNPTDHPIDIHFRVDYSGPLSGLLDQVASQVGVDWEYRGGRVNFLGAQTVTYTVWALPGKSSTNASVGGGGASNVFGGSSPATTERTIESDYWADLEAGLETIIPEAGSRYTVNKANGTIVVTALQNVHNRVTDFVEQENARLSRQVSVKVDVLAYTAENSDSRSTSIEGIMQNLAWGLGASITTPANSIDDAIGIGATILDNDNKAQENLVGTNAIMNALSRNGRVSLLDSVSVLAMNNVSTPIAIMKEQAYLAGTTTTVDEEGNTSTEGEAGIVNSGINMVVTPRILSGGEVNLDYTMNLSTLTKMEKFETDMVSMQLPEVESRNFMQSVNMDSGSSMVIAAYDSQRNTRGVAGPFDPRMWGLGGEDSYSTERTKIMVIITPVVAEKQNAPRLRR